MASFQDTTGKVWPVVINYDTLFRAKAAGHPLPAKMEDMKALADHLADPMNLFEVLCLVCRPEDAQVSHEDFAKRLDGDAAHAATIAVTEATILFFPQMSKAQKASILAAHGRAVESIVKKSVAALDSWGLDSDTAAPSA